MTIKWTQYKNGKIWSNNGTRKRVRENELFAGWCCLEMELALRELLVHALRQRWLAAVWTYWVHNNANPSAWKHMHFATKRITFWISETNTESTAIRRLLNSVFHCPYRSKRSQIIVFFFSLCFFFLPFAGKYKTKIGEINFMLTKDFLFFLILLGMCVCAEKRPKIGFRIEIYFIS